MGDDDEIAREALVSFQKEEKPRYPPPRWGTGPDEIDCRQISQDIIEVTVPQPPEVAYEACIHAAFPG